VTWYAQKDSQLLNNFVTSNQLLVAALPFFYIAADPIDDFRPPRVSVFHDFSMALIAAPFEMGWSRASQFKAGISVWRRAAESVIHSCAGRAQQTHPSWSPGDVCEIRLRHAALLRRALTRTGKATKCGGRMTNVVRQSPGPDWVDETCVSAGSEQGRRELQKWSLPSTCVVLQHGNGQAPGRTAANKFLPKSVGSECQP